MKLEIRYFVNDSTDYRIDFNCRDEQHRKVGVTVRICRAMAYTLPTVGYPSTIVDLPEPGEYYALHVQGLRDGFSYGASIDPQYFKTKREAEEKMQEMVNARRRRAELNHKVYHYDKDEKW